MNTTRTYAVIGVALIFLPTAWHYFRANRENTDTQQSAQKQAEAGADLGTHTAFFRPPTPRQRKAERDRKPAVATFPNGSLLSEEDYFSEPQTNVFNSSLRTMTIVSKKLVNTNALLARVEADEAVAREIAERLTMLKSEAASLTVGMAKSEVLRLFPETPSQNHSNHIGNWLIYSPHPARILPSLMDGRFEVLFVLFDSSERVSRFGYSRRLEGFWWVSPVR